MNFIGILENVSNMLQDSDKLFLKRNTPDETISQH